MLGIMWSFFSHLTQRWSRFLKIFSKVFFNFFPCVLAASWSQWSVSKAKEHLHKLPGFVGTKQAVALWPGAWQAQERQSDSTKRGCDHDLLLVSLCHTAGHNTTCAAPLVFDLFFFFFSGFVRTQVRILADPSCIPADLFSAVENMSRADQSPRWGEKKEKESLAEERGIGCSWEFFGLHNPAVAQMPQLLQRVFFFF